MIVMCHKPAQIINTARMSCDTICLTTYNGPDLFKNFNEIYKCEHDFSKIISELNSNHYSCTDAMSDEPRYGIIKYNKNFLPHSLGPNIIHLKLSGNSASVIISSSFSHDCRSSFILTAISLVGVLLLGLLF